MSPMDWEVSALNFDFSFYIMFDVNPILCFKKIQFFVDNLFYSSYIYFLLCDKSNKKDINERIWVCFYAKMKRVRSFFDNL